LEYLSVDGEGNIETDLKVIRWEGLEWIDLGQDSVKRRAVVNTFTGLRVR
jgi:hypothetical protein